MLIVADSSSIVNILAMDGLVYLHNMYDKVILPKGVYRELCIEYYRDVRIDYLDNDELCSVVECTDMEYLNSITDPHIHDGEKEALVLCKELNINNLLIDDKKAIRYIPKGINLNLVSSYLLIINNCLERKINVNEFIIEFNKLLNISPVNIMSMRTIKFILEDINNENYEEMLMLLKNVINQTYNNGR